VKRQPEGVRNDDGTMEYTETFRARMVRRMLGPKAVTASALAAEVGISQPTLSRWLRETGSVRAVKKTDDDKPPGGPDPAAAGPPRRPQDWGTEEKLRAVVETAALKGAELGEYLRRNGLHREQLDAWRGTVTTALERPASVGGRRTAAETKRIKELERELRRKEKALAETAALLVLRKKVEALWGAADDDTDGKNEP
jgi:transposase